jgi:hypothetical protein
LVVLAVLLLASTSMPSPRTETAQVRLLDPSGRARLKNALTLQSETIGINREIAEFNLKLTQAGEWFKVNPEKIQPHVDEIVRRWLVVQETLRHYDEAEP